MPNNESEFLIKIRTALEDQGIKLTDEQFEKLRKTAGRANEEIHEGHEKLKLDHRELRESIGAVGRAFGCLADVGLWLSPVTAALAAVLFVVDKLKEHFSALNEKIREYINTSREIRSDHMEAMEAATRATAEATADFAREARIAAEAQDKENTAMENRIALNEAYIDGLKKVQEAEEKSKEAEIDHDVEVGRISKEQAEMQKDILREKLAADTANLDLKKEQQRIAEHQRQLDEARARIPVEERARDAALARIEHPSVTASDTKREIDRQSKILKSQNDKVAASLAEAAEHRTPGSFRRGLDFEEDAFTVNRLGHTANTKAAAAEKQAAMDQKLADATAAYIRSLQEKQAASDRAVKDAKAEADLQNKKLEKDEELIRTAPDRIEQEKALAETHRQTADTVNAWNQKANVTREGDPRSADEIAASHLAGPEAAISASAAIDRALEIEAGMRYQRPQDRDKGQMAELHEILNRILGLQSNHAAELNSLRGEFSEQRRQIEMMESQSRNNRAMPGM